MKNIFLSLALCAALVITVNAQESYKPEAGKFGVELAGSPLLGVITLQPGMQFANDFEGFFGGQFKVSYYLSDNIGVRIGLGYRTISSNVDNGESGSNLSKSSLSMATFSFLPEFIYLFEGTTKLAPYVGAGLDFGSTSSETITENGSIKETRKNWGGVFLNTFGINVFTGFNYFIAENLFLGVEAGVGFASQTFKNSEITRTGDPNWTPPPKSKASSSNSTFGFNVHPMLRFGWFF